jgi:truncated hemoglobin YjbI
MTESLYEQLGSERKLRPIIDRFVDRVVGDLLIGYFFVRVKKDRLKQLEFAHAAAFLGAPIAYNGRSMAAAHARHRIMGGHFARRRTILKEVLQEFAVPEAIAAAWLAHQDSLRSQVVGGSS